MSKFYSKQTGGFYSLDIHEKDSLPTDAVEITEERWRELLDQQAAGKQIVCGVHGLPITIDPDPRSGLLVRRDAALRDSDWLVARHRDEAELGAGTTLTDDQFRSLQGWRRILRNITSHPEFPHVSLPERPV